MLFGALAVFCLFGGGVASADDDTAYEVYDCEYFSLEYPSDWIVVKKPDTSLRGWSYNFIDLDSATTTTITVSEDINMVTYVTSFDNVLNGTVSDEVMQHIIDRLEFELGSEGTSQTPLEYVTYDCMYFSVDRPKKYADSAEIRFNNYASIEDNSILDIVYYKFNLYNTAYDAPDDPMTIGQISVSDDGTIGVSILTERAGKFSNDVVKRFMKSLDFKA
ncbi:hypothetical protein [Methanothrix harundinacea]|nr:hypothetical protein [Methanothrix harundinacea]